MTHAQDILRKIPYGLECQLVVTELTNDVADKFEGNDGNMRYCYFFKAQYSEFPEPVNFQWCSTKNKLTEFKVGSIIKIKAGTYVDNKERQSVTWLGTSPTIAPSQKKQETQSPVYYDDKKSNPSIMGTLWSICMGHAIQLNKDRFTEEIKGKKTIKVYPTIQDVMMDAELLMADFKNKYGNDKNC